jgi:hypothetical protein
MSAFIYPVCPDLESFVLCAWECDLQGFRGYIGCNSAILEAICPLPTSVPAGHGANNMAKTPLDRHRKEEAAITGVTPSDCDVEVSDLP